MLLQALASAIDRAKRAILADTFQAADGDEVESIT